MTDRHAGYIVVLEADIREDDAADLINLMRAIRGVQAVTPIVSSPETMLGHLRARNEMREHIIQALETLP